MSVNNLRPTIDIYFDILDRNLDDVVIYPGEAHLDLVIQVRPARPVGQGPVQEGRDPGKALGEDGVQRGAHSVYKLNLNDKTCIYLI